MSSNIYITPRTSLVLIKSLAPTTNIYLSTYNVPDFQINIRDATGSSDLLTNPIGICTINGARFTNNTTSYAINQPYGFVNLSLRTSTLWQILHTSGQTPSESAANVNQTNISTAYMGFVSTTTKQVSTMLLENLETPNSIQLVGPFVIGNLSTPGFILFKSTLNVYGDTSLEKTTFVSGSTEFYSTLSAVELLPLSSVFRSYSSLSAAGSVFVGGKTQIVSTLETQSSLQVQTLDVQKSTIEFTTYLNTLSTLGLVSSLGDIYTSLLVIGENLRVTENISSLGGLFTTDSLTIDGSLAIVDSVSSLNYTSFQSSLQIQSSLTILNSLTALSSANVTKFVSTGFFSTPFLSTGTSVSTLGNLIVESNIYIKGTLSTNSLTALDFVSVGGNFVTMGSVSSLLGANLSSLSGDSLLTQSLSTQSLGIGGTATIFGNTRVGGSVFVNSNVKVGTNLSSDAETSFNESVGVATDIRVLGNLTINGQTTINSYDVTSFGVSTLIVTTSSPSVAFKASTLISPLVESLQGKFAFESNSGSILINIGNNAISTNSVYSQTFISPLLSTISLYARSVEADVSKVPPASLPEFEILQKSWFPKGLSTTFINASTITGTFIGNLIGDAQYLGNSPLNFENISASFVSVSSIESGNFSANKLFVDNLTSSTNVKTDGFTCIGTTGTMTFFSSSLYYPEDIAQMIGINFFPNNIEQLGPSTLAFNRYLYLDAGNQKVGIGISSPEYNLDISGLLAYTGTLVYDETAERNFVATTSPFYFSSLYFSSALIRDSLVLSNNFFLFPIVTPSGGGPIMPLDPNQILTIGNREFPFNVGTLQSPQLVKNSNYSTIDMNLVFFVYNNTKNVGVNTLQITSIMNVFSGVAPQQIPPDYDFYAETEFVGSNIMMSTLDIFAKLNTSSIVAPTLGFNAYEPSTLNTFSTPNLSTLILNNFVEFVKDTTLKGSLQIKRPVNELMRGTFAVYNDAYISTVTTTNLTASTIIYGFQDL